MPVYPPDPPLIEVPGKPPLAIDSGKPPDVNNPSSPGGSGIGSIFSGTGTGDGTVTQKVVQLPGMLRGELGTAGDDKPGPSIRTVAVPAWQYIGVEIAWAYLHSFLGILAMDGMGLINLAPAGEAFQHLYTVAGVALGPTVLALLTQLYQYLGKVRASRV